jgi:hypothetical protein
MDAHQIIPYLYLGSRDYTIEDLYKLNIDVAICMAPEDQVEALEDDKIKFLRFPVTFQQSDIISKKNMLEAVATCNKLIDEKQNIYLYCVAGYNRSAAIAVLIIEKQLKMTRDNAIEFIDKIHSIEPKKHLLLINTPDKEEIKPKICMEEVPIYYSICRSWSDGEDHDPEEENGMYNFKYFKVYEDKLTTIICSEDAIIMECNNNEDIEYDKIVSYMPIKIAIEKVLKDLSYIKENTLQNINIRKHSLNFIKNNE